MSNKQTTQLDRANSALIALSADVTTEDRREAETHYSEFTIVQYLKGRGKNLDTAMALLDFFRKRINNRDKKIA